MYMDSTLKNNVITYVHGQYTKVITYVHGQYTKVITYVHGQYTKNSRKSFN